jgi:hypothetical protein
MDGSRCLRVLAKAFRAWADAVDDELEEAQDVPPPRESGRLPSGSKATRRRVPVRAPAQPDGTIEVSELNRQRALRGLTRAGYFPRPTGDDDR